MFGTVLTVTYTVMLSYVVWRAATVPLLSQYLPRLGFVGLGVLMWILFYLGRHFGHGGKGALAGALEFTGMALLGSVVIVSSVLLAADLVTGFGWVMPAWARTIRGWALAAGACLSLFALIQAFRAPAVVSWEVALPGLPARLDGRILVAMSDAHLGSQYGEEWFVKRIAQVRALKPDLVVFLGDMFEGHGDVPADISALRKLAAPLGKWYVVGNHEGYGHGEGWRNALPRAGFRRLSDEWAEAAPGLVVAGVDFRRRRERRGRGDGLARALANRPPGATILLSHAPRFAPRAARAGVGLMLSGHTHGGQVWPFGLLVRRAYPLLAGRYDVEGMTVIVSRGVGTWGPRMRLWHRGEIVRVVLRKA